MKKTLFVCFSLISFSLFFLFFTTHWVNGVSCTSSISNLSPADGAVNLPVTSGGTTAVTWNMNGCNISNTYNVIYSRSSATFIDLLSGSVTLTNGGPAAINYSLHEAYISTQNRGTYYWQIRDRDHVASPIWSFTTELPDLTVISGPSVIDPVLTEDGFLIKDYGYKVKTTVKNIGSIDVEGASTYYSVIKIDVNNDDSIDAFYDDFSSSINGIPNPIIGAGAVKNLAVGEEQEFIMGPSTFLRFPSGAHKIIFCADRYNELSESNEDNNCAETVINVKPPSIILSGVVEYGSVDGWPYPRFHANFDELPFSLPNYSCEIQIEGIKYWPEIRTAPCKNLTTLDGVSFMPNLSSQSLERSRHHALPYNAIFDAKLIVYRASNENLYSNVIDLTTLSRIDIEIRRGTPTNPISGHSFLSFPISFSLNGPSGIQTFNDVLTQGALVKMFYQLTPGIYTLTYLGGSPPGFRFSGIKAVWEGAVLFEETTSTESLQLTIPDAIVADGIDGFSGGRTYGNKGLFEIYFSILPTVDLKVNNSDGPVSVLSGSTVNLSWTSTNSDTCTASDGWSGSKSVNGSFSETSAALTANTTFTITCTGIGGTVSDSVSVTVVPPGDINVKAILDGAAWSGGVNYSLSGPVSLSGSSVPTLFSNKPPGSYTISYTSGGPGGTPTITPVSSQVLPGNSAIEFVLNFTSICNDGQDNDGDGKTDYPNDKGCEGPTDPTETINLSCGGSPASPQLNQTVTWTASPSSGQTPYTYSWSGAVSGTTQSVQTSYSTTGTKTASVEVSSGTESKSTNCFVNVVSPPPPNNPPTAVAGISLDTTTFGSNISVTKGTPVTFNLSAWRGTQASPTSKSDDPDGWMNVILGMPIIPARCEWDTDLVQNAASFAPDLARGILPTFAECSDPDNNASNYITLTKTFNDNPGTYTYYVLKMTDRASGVSSPLGTVSVTVKAQCENGIDDDGDGLIDFGGANPDPGCSSSTDNDETDVVGPPPAPPNPPGGGDPPTSPVCVASNNPDIVLNWTDNSSNEDGFKIYRGTTGTFTPTDPPLITTGPNITTVTDTNPTPGITYYYKIASYNSGGNSSYLTLGPVTADSCAPTFVIIDSSGDANSTIQINETEQYDGKYDSDGPGGSAPEITAARASISWSSLDTSIATINPTGAAKGKAVGSTKIKGTYSGIIAEANIIVATCSNDCSPSGQASCQGNAVITCGNYDADSCLEWSSPPVACGAGKTCVSGNCISSPAITFTASPGTIRQGESTVLSWNATNVDSCEASGGWNSDWSGNKPISSASIPLSDRTVSPKRTSDYTLTCVNNITGEQVLETKVITVIVVPIIRPK